MDKMILTKERAELLTEALTSGGHDFTLGEIVAYGKTLTENLSDDVLEGVAGGVDSGMKEDIVITGTVVATAAGIFASGVTIGGAIGTLTRRG